MGVDASQPATIAATLDGARVETAIGVESGPASVLTVTRDGRPVESLLIESNTPVTLRVSATDPFGNRAGVEGLRASSEDESVFALRDVTTDSLGGTVVVRPGRDGSTQLAFQVGDLRKTMAARLLLSRLPYFTGYTHLYGRRRCRSDAQRLHRTGPVGCDRRRRSRLPRDRRLASR